MPLLSLEGPPILFAIEVLGSLQKNKNQNIVGIVDLYSKLTKGKRIAMMVGAKIIIFSIKK